MFEAGSIVLSGGFDLAAPVEWVFELFSPLGERLWVPGWDPELLHPPGVEWQRGLIFRTREARGEAVWVVTALDRERHEVEYHRVESGRYVAVVRVRCEARGARQTGVRVAYSFVGLSDAGNREIGAMSPGEYEEKMRRWKGWIDRYLGGSAP